MVTRARVGWVRSSGLAPLAAAAVVPPPLCRSFSRGTPAPALNRAGEPLPPRWPRPRAPPRGAGTLPSTRLPTAFPPPFPHPEPDAGPFAYLCAPTRPTRAPGPRVLANPPRSRLSGSTSRLYSACLADVPSTRSSTLSRRASSVVNLSQVSLKSRSNLPHLSHSSNRLRPSPKAKSYDSRLRGSPIRPPAPSSPRAGAVARSGALCDTVRPLSSALLFLFRLFRCCRPFCRANAERRYRPRRRRHQESWLRSCLGLGSR